MSVSVKSAVAGIGERVGTWVLHVGLLASFRYQLAGTILSRKCGLGALLHRLLWYGCGELGWCCLQGEYDFGSTWALGSVF